MSKNQDLFNELTYYTLAHPNQKYFIHQHIVDAYAAQKATNETKPIKLVFSLVGLYLFLEKNFTGREVQAIHMKLAEKKDTWPQIPLPENRGEITVQMVMDTKEGEERDLKIKEWCKSVWDSYSSNHDLIASFLMNKLGI